MTEAAPPPLDALLDQREWVRALARRLVGDGHDAEDLAQEALAVAIERPPRDARHPRGWLAQVLRNLVRQRGRRAPAAAALEVDAAASTPPVGEVLERAELHQLLVREVLALGEPYRTTVLLRYFDGLGPRAIAERLDVPLATVTSRLTRAHAALRERLDHASAPDGRHGVALLLPLITPRAGPALATSATLLMSAKLKIAATALLLVALGLTAARLLDRGPEDVAAVDLTPPADDAPPEVALGPAADEPAARTAAAPGAAGPDAAAAPGAALSGQVVDPAGAPAAGATVVLAGHGALDYVYDGEEPPDELVHAIADEAGRFVFTELPESTLFVTAGAPDAAPSETARLEPDQVDSSEHLTLILRRGVRIYGEVLREDGSLAARRRVRFLQETESADVLGERMMRSVLTDDQGRFDERHLCPGAWGLVSFPDDEEIERLGGSMAEQMLQATVSLEDGQEQLVVLGAPSAEAVRVTGTALVGDAPVTGFLQWIGECEDPMGSQQVAELDDEGRYEVELPQPGAWYVRATGRGATGEFYLDIPAVPEHVHDFALPEGELRGFVVDEAGDPVEGAWVTHLLVEGGAHRNPLRLADDSESTDAAGAFRFRGLSAGVYQLGASHATRGSAAGAPLVVRAGEAFEGVELVLAPGRAITGHVTDASGVAVKGVPVWIHDAHGRLVNPISRTTSSAEGRFSTPPLPPGEYALLAWTGAVVARELHVEVRAEDADEVLLVLRPGATLAVELHSGGERQRAQLRVTDLEGRLLTGLRSQFDPWSWRRFPFDSRRKHAGPLPAGTYVVTASAPELGEVSQEVTLSPEETRELELTLD